MSAAPKFTPERYSVRSLSPAYWYVCDVTTAKRERSRGQVSRPFGSEAEARAALAKVDA
jgi:hypothetical protein